MTAWRWQAFNKTYISEPESESMRKPCLKQDALFSLILYQHVIKGDGRISKGDAFEEDPLHQPWRLVLIHDRLHWFLDSLSNCPVIVLPHLLHYEVCPLHTQRRLSTTVPDVLLQACGKNVNPPVLFMKGAFVVLWEIEGMLLAGLLLQRLKNFTIHHYLNLSVAPAYNMLGALHSK